jgi:hypothetical protein
MNKTNKPPHNPGRLKLPQIFSTVKNYYLFFLNILLIKRGVGKKKLKDKRSILIINYSNLTHGAWNHINLVIRSFQEHDTFEIIISGNDAKLEGVNIVRCNHFYSKSFLKKLIYFFFFLPIFTRLKKFDVIYAPWGIAPFLKTKYFVVACHDPVFLSKKNLFINKVKIYLLAMTLRKADVVKFPSISYRDTVLKQLSVKDYRVIHHGVNFDFWGKEGADLFNNLPEKSGGFVCWSYFHRTKNIEFLIRSYRRYAAAQDNPKPLTLLGRFTSLEYRRSINALIKILGLTSQVRIIESPENSSLKRYIFSAFAIVLPFDQETFCYPFVESRFSSTPLAVIDTPLSREITEGQAYYFRKDEFELASLLMFLDHSVLCPVKYIVSNQFSQCEESRFIEKLLTNISE